MRKLTITGLLAFFVASQANAGLPLIAAPVHHSVATTNHLPLKPAISPLPIKIADHYSVSANPVGTATKVKKLGWRNRLALRMMSKKFGSGKFKAGVDLSEADKMAKSSRTLGIIALVLAIIPFYTIFAAIPLGIMAISRSNKARKMGSTKKNGKGLGIAALVIVGIWIIVAAFYVALIGEAFFLALFGAW